MKLEIAKKLETGYSRIAIMKIYDKKRNLVPAIITELYEEGVIQPCNKANVFPASIRLSEFKELRDVNLVNVEHREDGALVIRKHADNP